MKKLILSSIAMFLPALAFADVVGTGTIVGGDRDTHGCIGSAGYSWDATSSTCIRPWERTPTGTGQENRPMRPPQDGTGTMNRPPKREEMKKPPQDGTGSFARPPRGASGSMMPPPPKNVLGIDTKALETAMQNLSETDKAELAKTIQTFLESKGIKLPTAEEMQAKKGEIQQQKQEAKTEIKQARQEIQSARQDIKQARQNLRERKPLPPKNGTGSGTVAQ